MANEIRHRRQPRREATIASLENMARQLGPNARLPLFAELCQRLRVSKVTLDSALRDLETRGVLERKHGVGIFVSQQVQREIMVVCDAFLAENVGEAPFWSLLIAAIEKRVATAGFEYSIRLVRNNEDIVDVAAQLCNWYEQQQVQAFVILNLATEASHRLAELRAPTVVFAGYADWMVSLDQDYMVSGGLWHLKRAGCRHIEIWSPAPEMDAETPAETEERQREFRRALTDNDLDADSLRGFAGSDNKALLQDATRRTEAIFAQENPPDGLVITHDFIALGALRGLDKLKIEIGRDIHMVAASNRDSPILKDYENQIVLMEFDSHHLAGEIIELVERQMSGQSSGEHRVVRPFPRLPKNLRIFV